MTNIVSGKRRYLALFFPFLPAERWLRTAPRPPDAPLIFAEKQRGAMRLASVDAAALAVGLRPGMPLADARAQIGELVVVPHDPVLDQNLRTYLFTEKPIVYEEAAAEGDAPTGPAGAGPLPTLGIGAMLGRGTL